MFLTGGLRFDGPGGSFVDADLPGVQGRVAFAALVMERRPITRDALAEIVWNGLLPPKWEGALSTIISKLRKLISLTDMDGKRMVSTVGARTPSHCRPTPGSTSKMPSAGSTGPRVRCATATR